MSACSELYDHEQKSSGPYTPVKYFKNVANINTVNKNKNSLTGNNNGMSGFGQYGLLVPPSLNGPFGFVNRPLPLDKEEPTGSTHGPNPQYNSKYFQGPQYNEQSFINSSGHNGPDQNGVIPYSFSSFSKNQSSSTAEDVILEPRYM